MEIVMQHNAETPPSPPQNTAGMASLLMENQKISISVIYCIFEDIDASVSCTVNFFPMWNLWPLEAKLCSPCIFIPLLPQSIIAHKCRTQRPTYELLYYLALVW